jgi:hypothetical protein
MFRYIQFTVCLNLKFQVSHSDRGVGKILASVCCYMFARLQLIKIKLFAESARELYRPSDNRFSAKLVSSQRD